MTLAVTMKNYLNFNCITEIRLNNKKNMTTRTGKACEKGDGDGFKKPWEEKKLKKEKKSNHGGTNEQQTRNGRAAQPMEAGRL